MPFADWLQKSPLPLREGAIVANNACLFSSLVGGLFSSLFSGFFRNVSSFFSFLGDFFSSFGGFLSSFCSNFSGFCFNRRLGGEGHTGHESCSSNTCEKFLHKSFPS